jgi:hypothetical protein
MASRTKGGGSHSFGIKLEAEGIEETIEAFNRLQFSEQLKSYRKAAGKSARTVRKSMKRLTPRGLGLDPEGEPRPHLRDVLTFNVKTLGRAKSRFVSAIVGADYKKVPTIHLVNNMVKAHRIKVQEKRVLSDQNSAGDDINVAAYGTQVTRPMTPGEGFMQEAARANVTAIKNYYIEAIREAVEKSRVRGT